MNDTPPASTQACPAPGCEYLARDSYNCTLHFMRQHVEGVCALVVTADARALTSLACAPVFAADLTVSLFVLAHLAASASPTLRAQAASILNLSGVLVSRRSVPMAPVLAECRTELVSLLVTHNTRSTPLYPTPHQQAAPPPAEPVTPPAAVRRAPTPNAPRAPRVRVLRAGEWHIAPRRLFPPIPATIWDEARGAPTVEVFKEEEEEDYTRQLSGRGVREPIHECAICMEPAWVKIAIPPMNEDDPVPWAHLSCSNPRHWIHDTCLAAYIEHQLAERGIREIEVRRAAEGNDETRLLGMEAAFAQNAGPFACAHCRKRYESYHAMAKFVGWVRSFYVHYRSPNYAAVRMDSVMSAEAEHLRQLEGFLLNDDGDEVVIDVDAPHNDDDGDDGSFVGDSADESAAAAAAARVGPVYNLRVRRNRVMGPHEP